MAGAFNAGNSIIYLGKGGDIPANRGDEQELSVLCLRVLQAAVVYVSTLMVRDVLAEGLVELGAADRRGLTLLFWTNVSPYGSLAGAGLLLLYLAALMKVNLGARAQPLPLLTASKGLTWDSLRIAVEGCPVRCPTPDHVVSASTVRFSLWGA